jgi:hypothetical protein
MNTVEEILRDAKTAYKESIHLNNDILEECLLAIMGNAKLILNNKILHEQATNSSEKTSEASSKEIQKVQRKVPKWLHNPSQYNTQILNAYMLLSSSNLHSITTSELEQYLGMEPNKFLSNFNQMKTISEKNHAKVFHEEHGNVKLWEPVAEFIIKQFDLINKGNSNER